MGLWDSKKEWEEYLGPFVFGTLKIGGSRLMKVSLDFFKMKLPG